MNKTTMKLFACRVCGLIQDEYPWGEDGKTSSFNICSCCAVTFGYEDNNTLSTIKYREKWVADGKVWFSPEEKPNDWDFEEQFKSVQERLQDEGNDVSDSQI